VLVIAASLALITIAVYWPATGHDFISLDDPDYATDNKVVQRGLTWEGVKWAFTTHHAANWHPLTWLSHMLDCTVFGLDPRGPHLVNILLHAANTVFVFVLFRNLTVTVWRSAILAAFFAWHPLHVESVAWVSERKDMLNTLFGLFAIFAYHRWTLARKIGWYLTSLLMFMLALLAKPMLVTLPFVLILLDIWPLRRLQIKFLEPSPLTPQPAQQPPISSLLIEKAPYLLVTIAFCISTILAQQAGGAVAAMRHLSLFDRLANAVFGYSGYLSKTFWPTELIIPYLDRNWSLVSLFLRIAALIGISAVAIVYRRKGYLATGWLFFLGTLVPVIGFVQVGMQTMADRYTYFPLLGIFVAVIWGAYDLCQRFSRSIRVGAVLAALALMTCLKLTARQITYWEDSKALFGHTLSVERRNPVAQNSLGFALLNEGDWPEAIHHLSKAVELTPWDPDSRCYLATALTRSGRGIDAIRCYQTNLATQPDHPRSLSGLAESYASIGLTNEAVATYQKRLSIPPELPSDHLGFATLLDRIGRVADAETEFRKVIAMDPTSSLSHYNFAVFLSARGRPNDADAAFAKAASLDPPTDAIYHQWACHLLKTQRPNDALATLRQGLLRFDGSIQLLNAMARILASHPDEKLRNPAEALRVANLASASSESKNPFLLDTLAACLASAGRFQEAAATERLALERIPENQPAKSRTAFQTRLALYTNGTPYRTDGDWLTGN
jgi:Flp pilus assembly protein TadD